MRCKLVHVVLAEHDVRLLYRPSTDALWSCRRRIVAATFSSLGGPGWAHDIHSPAGFLPGWVAGRSELTDDGFHLASAPHFVLGRAMRRMGLNGPRRDAGLVTMSLRTTSTRSPP